MAIPTSKPLAMSTVQTEYGGTNPINLSEYYGKGNAPASGEITLWADFNGTSNIVTVTNVSQEYNWYGDSTYTTEDTTETAVMIAAGTGYRPSLSAYTLYSYIDEGEPWLGKTITAYSNLRIEMKRKQYAEQDGSFFDPPIVIAKSETNFYAETSSGATVAFLGTDSDTTANNGVTRTLDVITNANITAAMTDAEIKTWLSSGCPLRHSYTDDDVSDGGNSASVDAPTVFIVRIEADSITYLP